MFDWIEEPQDRANFFITIVFLIIGNLIAFYGVLFAGWNLADMLMVYWFEFIVVGVFTILKMSKEDSIELSTMSADGMKMLSMAIFATIYAAGVFGYYYLITVTLELKPSLQNTTLLLGMIMLTHGFSYFFDFLKKRKYEDTTVQQELNQLLCGRLLVIQMIVIGGSVLLKDNQFGQIGLVIFLIGKSVVDVVAYISEFYFREVWGTA